MTSVVDEDEGPLLATLPVIIDRLSQISDQVLEGLEVGVFNHLDIHLACAQSDDTVLHIPRVIVDLFDVLKFFVSIERAQEVVMPVLDDEPLEVMGLEGLQRLNHPFRLIFIIIIIVSKPAFYTN